MAATLLSSPLLCRILPQKFCETLMKPNFMGRDTTYSASQIAAFNRKVGITRLVGSNRATATQSSLGDPSD